MPERHRLQSPSGGWFSRQRVLSESLGILVFIGLAGLGWHRIHLGVDLTDEGFYLSTPYRYTLGDLPFRDETMNPYRMFDILLAPVFRLWPGMTVLQARVLGLALDLGSLFAVYLLLKRRAPPILVALACVSGAFGCGNIWTPGYNLLGRDLLLLGVCAWLGSCLQTRPWAGRTLAFVGGVLACLSCIAYGPNVLIASVPLALLAWLALRGRLRSPTAARTLVFAASWGALGLGCLATGLASGLYADWRYACAFQATLPAYSASLPARLRSFWSEGRPLVPPFLAALGGTGCVLALVSRARSQRRWFWLAAACGVSGGSAYACTVYPSRFAPYALGDHVPFCVMMAALAFLAAAVLLPATAPDELRTDAADGIFVRRALLTVVLLFAIIEGLGSANGLRNALYGAGFLLAVAVAILSCRADGAERAGALSLHQRVALQCCLGLACAAYGALSIRSNFGHVCRDASTPQLTARFTHPLLAGIRS
ncbi:MAG: hypothetical protein NTW87_16375, partial [Planctomycetota bacterium]|nr:hypothetical protein [Planctomycetota bacterium]